MARFTNDGFTHLERDFFKKSERILLYLLFAMLIAAGTVSAVKIFKLSDGNIKLTVFAVLGSFLLAAVCWSAVYCIFSRRLVLKRLKKGTVTISQLRRSKFSESDYILLSGVQGEFETRQSVVKELPRSYMVLQDVYIKHNGKSEIDFIVIGPFGVTVIESKNNSGIISGKISDEYWERRHRGSDKVDRIYSPVRQVGVHIDRLKDYLSANGISISVRGAVFYNGASRVDVKGRSDIPVFTRSDGGVEKMVDYISAHGDRISRSMQNRIVSLLK